MRSPVRQERLWAGLGLVVLCCAWFGPQLFSSGVPFRRDTLQLYLPLRQYLHEQIRSGRLPQWFPYEGLGVPFIGQFVTATFHPASWIFLPFSPAVALKLNLLTAYLMALIGGYRFARACDVPRYAAVCGGVSLAFAGYALSMSDNLPFLQGLAALPWVGWAAVRLARQPGARHVAALALAWGLVLLGGDVQSFALAGVLVLTCLLSYWHDRSALVWTALGLSLAIGVASIELFPASSVFGASTRLNSGLVIDPATYWALRPWRIPEFFVPHYLPSSSLPDVRELLFGDRFQWATTIFCGGTVLLLLIAGAVSGGRRAIAFAALALGAFWMATGGAGGLLPLVWKIVPPLASFRFPEKYLGLFVVAAVPLVAMGAQAALQSASRWSVSAWGGAFALFFASLLVRSSRLTDALAQRAPDPVSMKQALADQVTSNWSDGLRTTAIFLAVLGLVLALRPLRQMGAILLPLLVAGELWLGNSGAFPLVPRDLLDPPASPFAENLQPDPASGPIRLISVARPRPETSNDQASHEGWVQASLALLKPDISGLVHASTLGVSALPGQSERTRAVLGTLGVRAPQLAPLFGACRRIVDAGSTLASGETVVASDDSHRVRLTTIPCRPSAYFADAVPEPALTRLPETLAAMTGVGSVWTGPARAEPRASNVEWIRWSPGDLELRTEASESAALIVSEGYAEGWRAEVDGAPSRIYPANGMALGVAVPEGKHSIRLIYEVPRLWNGAMVSFASLLTIAVLLIFGRKQSFPTDPRAELA